MLHDIRPDKTRWLTEAIELMPDFLRADARDFLAPLLKRCNAKTKKTFWQWLRLTCAKSEDTVGLLYYMQESRLRHETVTPTNGPRYVVNGDVALVEVIDGEKEAVWSVPANRLSWALNQFPVHLKLLPPAESPVTKEIRLLERRLARDGWRLLPEHKADILRRIGDLELERLREFKPEPRYMLMRYDNGRELLVHREFVDAGPEDVVEPIDGDLLNFTTAKVTVTVSASSDNGILVRRGDRPFAETQEFIVPNLRVVNSATGQARFENAMLQTAMSDGEPVETPLKVQPNAAWADAGRFRALTPDEIATLGRGNVELATDQPDDVGKLCREQSPRAREWDSRHWRTIPAVAKK